MIFPLSFLLGPVTRWLLRRKPSLTQGHAERQASLLLWAALALAIVVGAGLWLHFHDKGVIERHDDKRRAEEAELALERTHAADANEAARAKARTAASTTTQDELETIHAEDPAAAAAPASRGTRTVAKRLPVQP